jgi:hypothetical protein
MEGIVTTCSVEVPLGQIVWDSGGEAFEWFTEPLGRDGPQATVKISDHAIEIDTKDESFTMAHPAFPLPNH